MADFRANLKRRGWVEVYEEKNENKLKEKQETPSRIRARVPPHSRSAIISPLLWILAWVSWENYVKNCASFSKMHAIQFLMIILYCHFFRSILSRAHMNILSFTINN